MRLLKLFLLCLVTGFMYKTVQAQIIPQLPTNANINIVTANAGIVNQGGIIDLSVSVTNTGANPIQANRVRPSISIPIAIATALPNASQTGLPAGWSIVANSGAVITICNGTDVIPAGQTRTAIIKIQGTALGGPSTISGTLQFGPGTAVCTGLGTLNGDAPADNTSTTTVTVVTACPLTVSASAGTITCNGGTTTITATATGAAGAVEYRLNTGAFQTSNTFTVPAGTYTVLARQVNNINCTALSSTLIIAEPLVIVTPIVGTITQPTCTIATGSVQLSGLPTGNWTINPGNISGSGSSTTIANLTNGTYNFIVTNTTGCSSIATAAVVINTQPATPAVPIVGTITQPICTAPVGSVILSGLPLGNWTINPGNIAGSGTTTTVGNLLPGTFNFTVTNADGCTSNGTANVIIDAVTGIPAAPTVSIVQPTCTNANGIITVTSNTSGLTFSFDNAAYIAYPVSGFSAGEGNHTLSVQTAASCISANTNVVINAQPSTPAAPTVNIIQPSCTLATAIVTITSPTTGFTFSLDGAVYAIYPNGGYMLATGAHTLNAQNLSGCISAPTNITINQQPETPTVPMVGTITQPTCIISSGSVVLNGLPAGNWVINPGNISGTGSSFTLTGLANGNYNFTVSNAAGCVSAGAASVSINAVPGAPVAPTVSVIQPTCTNANGTITITSDITGLLFSFDGGSYLPYPTTGYIVPAGAHTLLAQNAAFCISAVTNVTINNQPATPAAPIISVTQPSCTIATATVIINSNTGSLLFSLDGGAFVAYPVAGYILATGTHTLIAQNAAGCISTSTNIIINAQPPTPVTPTVNIVQPTCAVVTGVVTITSTTTGLLFSIDGGTYAAYPATGYALISGAHTLRAQNSSGCISTIFSFNINTQPPTPVVPIVSIVQPSCTVATGLLTVTSTTTGLTFSLDGAAYQPYPTVGYNLISGAHTLSAQNSFGCISTVVNITINAQPALPLGTLTAGNIICNGGTTTLTVNASGAVTPYEYSLDGVLFQSANTFTVGAGTYTVTIKSANTCAALTNTITLTQPTAIVAAVVGGTISCNGGSANLTVTATGGTPPLQYNLNGGTFQTSNIFTVGAGTQTIIVRDANGCTKTANVVTLSQPVILKATASAPRILYCGGKTVVTVAATGGTAPYTGIGTFTKDAGIFTFTVTDANGCVATTQIDNEAPGCMTLQGYPNPAKEFITINHTIAEAGATMQLYTSIGQKLLTLIVPVDAFKTTIDIRKYAFGLYVLVYQNGKDRKNFLFEKIN
jgi:large repetitive protein